MRFVFSRPNVAAEPDDTGYDVLDAADAQVGDLTDTLTDDLAGMSNQELEWEAIAQAIQDGEDLTSDLVPDSVAQPIADATDPVVQALVDDVALLTARDLYNQIENHSYLIPDEATFMARFDLKNPLAVDWIKQNGADLVVQIASDLRIALRDVIARGFQQGNTVAEMAREIQKFIPLTAQGMTALQNFEAALNARTNWTNLPADLVAQMRRAGLSDSVIQGMIGKGPISQQRIDQLVERYRTRLIRDRAETIARTETIRASNMGQQALWQQAVENGTLDGETLMRVWIVTPDDRLCPWCSGLGGVTVGLNEAFESGIGSVLTPPLHPKCRCTVGLQRVKIGTDLTGGG